MSRPADEEMIGRNVAGKFLVEKFLGGGAMGAVYKAYQKSIEKHVAIKVLHKEFVVEPTFVSRFEREAKAASLLDHINLMRVIDYGREPDGVCYIAMELLEGRTLFQVLKEDGRLSNERLAGLVRQTLAGLAVAHEMGIIHRDLKPENIVVLEKSDDDGKRAEVVKVCDFGMAKLVTPDADKEGGQAEAPLSSEKLTSHGVVVGTPDYMSPEQGRGERLDIRSDLYAVGVILYQMLTGRLPFSAETPIATLLRHVIDEPTPPSEIDPDVHSGLESICLRALAKRREDRFQTAREMRAEIRVVMEGRGVAMPSALPPPRLTLGSIPDADPATMDLRPPGVPKSLDFGAPRSQMSSSPALTPPYSHRIRAVEVLRDEPPPARKWTAPLAVAVVLVLAGGTLFGIKQRRAQLAHRAPPSEVVAAVAPATPGTPTPATPTPATATPATPTTEPAPAPEAPAAQADPAHATVPSAEAKASAATYGARSPGSLTVQGLSKVEPAASAAPAPSAAVPAFGVLAEPEDPKIAGSPDPAAPAPSPPAVASAPPAAPATEDPFAHAKVAIQSVNADKVASGDVVAALPSSRFDRCYRQGLTSHGSSVGGNGRLHLSIDSTGHIGSASFAGSGDLTPIGQCIVDAAIGKDIKHVQDGVTGADVELVFRPE